MSINDLIDEIENVARRAVLNELKKDVTIFLREELMEAVKHELDMADDQCNQCDSHRED